MGPGWLREGDVEPEIPDPTPAFIASFSEKCNSITILGGFEGLFVIGRNALAGSRRRAKGYSKA